MAKSVIYITNSTVQNTGDVALILATLKSLKQRMPSTRVIVESSHPQNIRHFSELHGLELYPRILNIESLDRRNKLAVVLEGGLDITTFFICALLQRLGLKNSSFAVIRRSRKKQAQALAEATIILSAAGGYLNTRYFHYSMRLYMYLLGIVWRKKVILFTQSIGPFETRLSRILIPAVLNKVHAIAVREPASLEYLKEFNIKAPITLTSDIAFLFTDGSKAAPEKLVAFCIKQTNRVDKRTNYKQAMIAAAEHLKTKGYEVIFVSHVHDDDKLCQELAQKTGSKAELSSPNAYHFKDIYRRSSFVISSRLHCIILASEFQLPFIAISYEPKFDGLAQQLDYPRKFLIAEESITKNKIVRAIDQLIQEQAELKSLLIPKLASLREAAWVNLDWLNEVS